MPDPLPPHPALSPTAPSEPHLRCAVPHLAPDRGARLLAAALFLALACDRGGAGETPPATPDATAAVQALIQACRPVDPIATSDVHDRAFRAAEELRQRLCTAGVAVGRAALEAYRADPQMDLAAQTALLEVAASNCAEETAPLLARLITTYDGERGPALATQAVRILAETSPQRAIALFEPMLREPWAHQTRPPQEALVDGWARAAARLGLTDAKVLCDLVVDIRQPPDARYIAVNKLTQFGSKRAQQALQEVLIEASSDGNIRRKAAQSLLVIMPREEFCRLVTEVSEHDPDPVFLTFLGDMLDKHCGGR